MGVHGLWKLIEPSGKVVPLDTLEGKVLAVDISIWLHQAIKGYQDSKGAPVPNAHLLTIYKRVCKLLYFRIKPVFVFDGGVPALKKETIAKRNHLKARNQSEANKIQKQLINTLLKHSAVSKVLSEKTKAELSSQAKKIILAKNDTDDDLFVLPPSQTTYESSDSCDDSFNETSATSDSSPTKNFNIHDIDVKSEKFKSLPADVRHEILSDLKETRKQNSWGRIHEFPKQSDDFATYQMNRLLKRNSIQTCLAEAEKEMGGASLSLNELESLLNDHGVITENKGTQIANDENSRYLYIKDVKKALESSKQKELKAEEAQKLEEELIETDFQKNIEMALHLSTIPEGDENGASTSTANSTNNKLATELLKEKTEGVSLDKHNESNNSEFDSDLEAAIQLSLQTDVPIAQTSSQTTHFNDLSHDKEFQTDLEAAIQLSLQETPTTSSNSNSLSQATPLVLSQQSKASSDDVSSSATTPTSSQDILNIDMEFSAYLHSLKDSDFDSSDDDVKLDDSLKEGQKATDKIFSAARSYMMEYGGLTQAGVAEIFGQTDVVPKAKNKTATSKRKSVSCKSSNNIISSSQPREIIIVSKDNESEKDEIGIMSLSDSSSDDDFVDVPSAQANSDTDLIQESKAHINKQSKELKNKASVLQINFNAKDELVDDIFSDIFDSQSEASAADTIPEKVAVISQEKSSDTSVFDSSVDSTTATMNTLLSEDVEAQKAIEESIKLINAQAAVEKVEEVKGSASSLMKELILQKPSSSADNVTVEDLVQLKSTLNQAQIDLIGDKGTKERLAGNISDQMYQEAQDLLSLFGIPYIIAPMEAEAQCAFLNEIDLTDGTITDDSDIWLFGGKTVYKNFFNHDKQVLEFKSESIYHHFKLSRPQFISLAMLVGSDYTTGIQGIGPVTALEVLAAFPTKSVYEIISSLEKFRDWFKAGMRVYGRGKAFLRTKLKNVELHDGFPSSSVLRAYLEPTIETSRDTFTWGTPRVEALINYTREKFGWNEKKVNDTLDPVLRRLKDNTSQKRIQDYFKTVNKPLLDTSMEIKQKLSKRVQKALGTIGTKGDTLSALSSSDEEMSGVVNGDEMEAVEVLKRTKKLTKQKSRCIQKEVETQLKILDKKKAVPKAAIYDLEVKKPKLANLHRKDTIHQKEIAKSNQLQNKLKAIEVFRKSSKGPGYVKKKAKVVRKPKDEAELSETESD